VGHTSPGNAASGRQGIADDSYRAIGDCLINVEITIGMLALHCDETPTRLNATAVIVQSDDRRIAAFVQIFCAVQ